MKTSSPDIEKLPPRHVEVELQFLPSEAGGRIGPVSTGYRPQFFYNGLDYEAAHTYPDVAFVNPGDSARAYLGFARPQEHVGKLKVGTVFLVREGQRTVAYGRVTAVPGLENATSGAQKQTGGGGAA